MGQPESSQEHGGQFIVLAEDGAATPSVSLALLEALSETTLGYVSLSMTIKMQPRESGWSWACRGTQLEYESGKCRRD